MSNWHRVAKMSFNTNCLHAYNLACISMYMWILLNHSLWSTFFATDASEHFLPGFFILWCIAKLRDLVKSFCPVMSACITIIHLIHIHYIQAMLHLWQRSWHTQIATNAVQLDIFYMLSYCCHKWFTSFRSKNKKKRDMRKTDALCSGQRSKLRQCRWLLLSSPSFLLISNASWRRWLEWVLKKKREHFRRHGHDLDK